MAQIWVSYSELGELCGCSPQAGRAHAVSRRWAEQIGRDGLTRVLLPDDLAHDFMAASSGRAPLPLDHVADVNILALSLLSRANISGAANHEMPARGRRMG